MSIQTENTAKKEVLISSALILVFFTTIFYGAFMPCVIKYFKSRDTEDDLLRNSDPLGDIRKSGSGSLDEKLESLRNSLEEERKSKGEGDELRKSGASGDSNNIGGNVINDDNEPNSVNDYNFSYLHPNFESQKV